MYKPVTTI